MPFLHPLGSVFLIAVFFIILLSIVFNKLDAIAIKYGKIDIKSSRIAIRPMLLISLIFFLWFCSFLYFDHTVIKYLIGSYMDWNTCNRYFGRRLEIVRDDYI
jgi:hypothetical protein